MAETHSTPESPSVLLIEDEREMAQEIYLALRDAGYTVRIAETEAEVFTSARAHPPAAMIVDRLLHGKDCLSMIEQLRAEGNTVPMVVISALNSVDDRIRGLRAGSDDYLVKPFVMGELVARVAALLRRSHDGRAINLKVGPLSMDLIERSVKRGDRAVTLLPREFNLLEYLMRHPNQVITRAMLLEDVWHYRTIPQTNVVDVHIGKLRRKVDGPGEVPLIETIRAIGFMLHGEE
ncbi:MAG TPA: response regulator transcription factor [Methylovirgula sp.]